MNHADWQHTGALTLCVTLGPVAQLLLKRGASAGATAARSFVSPWTLGGYGVFGVVTVLAVYAFQQIELKTAAAWTSLTYLLVILLARIVLGEPLTRNKLVGGALIVAGVTVFNLDIF